MPGKWKIRAALLLLGAVHAVIVFAGFVSPYDPASQNRDFPFVPPMRLHFVDAQSHFHLRPSVCVPELRPGTFYEYTESCARQYPVGWFVPGSKYLVAGLFSSQVHLFGLDAPAQLYLLGSDNYGRDVFSRVLYGGRISVAAGLLATTISLLLGTVVGTLAGFYGRWIDEGFMRLAELFAVLPWLYFLLAVRAFLPLQITPLRAFFLVVAVIGGIGWARPARLVRGIVLSAKNREYVVASRGFGASDAHILFRHVLPHTYGVLLTQAALLIPQFVVAEVTLSFFGLGLNEPLPSWGNLLAALQQYNVLVSYWWMFAPAFALVILSLGYLLVADAIQQQLQTSTV